jgi:hypothetical protein
MNAPHNPTQCDETTAFERLAPIVTGSQDEGVMVLNNLC